MCHLPVPNQTRKFGCVCVCGGEALIPSPNAVGPECVPPPQSSIPFLLPLLIPCSLVVTKLICNSCVATQARYEFKRQVWICSSFSMFIQLNCFYQQRHAGRYVVTRDVLAPWRHVVTRRKAYPTYSGPRKVYNICCTKFSLNNFYKLDNNYFKISKHKISRLQSVNL